MDGLFFSAARNSSYFLSFSAEISKGEVVWYAFRARCRVFTPRSPCDSFPVPTSIPSLFLIFVSLIFFSFFHFTFSYFIYSFFFSMFLSTLSFSLSFSPLSFHCFDIFPFLMFLVFLFENELLAFFPFVISVLFFSFFFFVPSLLYFFRRFFPTRATPLSSRALGSPLIRHVSNSRNAVTHG